MKTRHQVLAALAQTSLTTGGITSALGISSSAARRALGALIDAGQATECGTSPASPSDLWRGGRHKKVYTITPAGRAHLSTNAATRNASRFKA